ncbi:MAG: hypothetical protein WBD40_06770 [Tepidisphaeraceae bacterium]
MPFTVRSAVLIVALTTPFVRAADPATRPAAAAATTTSTAPAISDAALTAALDAADRQPLPGPAFDQILQSVSSRFPILTVSTERGQPVWNKVTLNRRGKQVDAFRFRVPQGERRDMLWSFLCNDLRYEWYIIPATTGRMTGFRRNWYYKPQDILGDRTPAGSKDLVLQALDAANFKPGDEYLIWFKFRHAKAMPMYIAINLLPAAEDPAAIESSSHIANAVGLSRAGGPIDALAIDLTPSTQPAAQPTTKKAAPKKK